MRLALILIKSAILNNKEVSNQVQSQYQTKWSKKATNLMMTVKLKMTNFEYLFQIYKYILVLLDLVSDI